MRGSLFSLGRVGGLVAAASLLVALSARAIGVFVLHPEIEDMVKIVKVLLLSARIPKDIVGPHSSKPAVVLASSFENISANAVEDRLKVFGTGSNIVLEIVAISTGCAAALVGSDLHHTNLAGTAGDFRSAR